MSPALRNESTSFFNLVRNIGSSIGISVIVAALTHNIQTVHMSLSKYITPYSMQHAFYVENHIDPTSTVGLIEINNLVTRQATMIAYIDDFYMMMLITIAVMPLVFLLKKVEKPSTNKHQVME